MLQKEEEDEEKQVGQLEDNKRDCDICLIKFEDGRETL